MIEQIDLNELWQIIGLCVCFPTIAIVIAVIIIAVRGRLQVLKNERDSWLK